MKSKDKIKKLFKEKPIVWINAWGISKLRKRGGTLAGAIAGNAIWYDEWYNRVMSKDTARKFSELGVNLVGLPFSMGGDARTEDGERSDFKRMTSYLNEFGIRTVAYIQYQNVLQETERLPNFEWAIGLDASTTTYGNVYWRRTACQSGKKFINYLKGLISDAIARGANGIFIDNDYMLPCRCESCMKGFRKFLSQKRRHLLDELYFENFNRIEMPNSIAAFDLSDDPIIQALMNYNCERNLNVHLELMNHLESLDPYGLMCLNPALWRGNNTYMKGIDLMRILSVCDLVYLENKFFPGISNGNPVGNYHGEIAALSCGSFGIPGAWKKGDFDTSVAGSQNPGFPSGKDDIEKVFFEALTFNGIISMLWAVRTMPLSICSCEEDLLKMFMEWDRIYPYEKKTLSFIRELPVFCERENIANIAVLYHRETLELDHFAALPSLHLAEEFLLKSRLPYNTVFSESIEDVYKYKMLVLPNVSLLSEKESRMVSTFVENGGKLLSFGLPGVYDLRKRPRKDSLLKTLINASVFDHSDEFIENKYSKGETLYIPAKFAEGHKIANMMSAPDRNLYPMWTDNFAKIKSSVLRLLGGDLQISVKLDGVAGVSLSRLNDGRKAVQIFSYEDETKEQMVFLKISNSISCESVCEWITPDLGSVIVKGSKKASYHEFKLPGFIRYGTAILK